MGKKTKGGSSLGRTIIRDRFGGPSTRKLTRDQSMLHTTEIQDGYDWGRLNLQSVTEESSFQEFLSTAELAGTEYKAEKLNIKFVNPRSNVGLLTKEETNAAIKKHKEHMDLIKIPRRPPWTEDMTTEQLNINEKEHFLEWRRTLSKLQEEQGVILTPYEKNLEFWRQLWRVVERSDVVVQIVDARNPLLFLCEDLEKYVKEVSEDKMNLVLVNKADHLTEKQRQYWADYFTSIGKNVAFFSAALASEKTKISEETESDLEEEDESEETDDNDENTEKEQIKKDIAKLESAVDASEIKLKQLNVKVDEILKNNQNEPSGSAENENLQNLDSSRSENKDNSQETKTENSQNNENLQFSNSFELLSRDVLINLFKTIHYGPKVTENRTTIGLVGYPNVGKSSTINALLTFKKVSVSATPGKTRHFQTLFLDNDLMLCDCPGLVMPSFVFTKAEMIINGILPIDQMRDHVPPVNLVSSLIPRDIIGDTYGIMIPKPLDGEDLNRCPYAEEILNAYAFNRGFMTANGQPDNPRAARYILKDYMNGKLLYVHAPPGVDQNEYQTWPERKKEVSVNRTITPREARAIKSSNITSVDVDKEFFSTGSGVHIKGAIPKPGAQGVVQNGKPWKEQNKHKNKKKKEKLRRLYTHLDQH